MSIAGFFSGLNRSVKERLKSAKLIKAYLHDKAYISTLIPAAKVPGTMLVLRLDDIGDYILFRNALALFKRSGKYKDTHITLCANKAWQSLFEAFDNNTVDDVIWIDKSRWHDEAYRFDCYKTIASRGFETVIGTSFTRNFTADDLLAMAAFPEHSFAWALSYSKLPPKWYKVRQDSFKTEINSDTSHSLEYLRNIELIEKLTNESFDKSKPLYDTVSADRKNEIVIFPGASKASKRWPAGQYAALADRLLEHDASLSVLIAGSKADKEEAGTILKHSKYPGRIADLTGTTSLEALLYRIAGSRLLITNDTVALHMAVAVNTPVLCIANGTYHWRYTDYSVLPGVKAITLLPPHVENMLKQRAGRYFKTTYHSAEIKGIQQDKVYQAAIDLLEA